MARWNMPVEPDELLYALKVGNAAALNQMPLKHTPGQGLKIVDEETGQVQTVHFADNAVNRFGVAKDGELSKGDFEKGADIKIDHIIPFDAKPFAASDGTGKPLVKVGKNSKAVAALRELARGVAGQKQKQVQASLWQRLLKGIK